MNRYLDAAIDGVYTAGTTLLGYMVGVGTGGPVMPSKAALFTAFITGVIGFANQLRGLNRPASS
jgi:hypothetical protein